MALDGRLLARAREKLAGRRAVNEAEHARRVAEAHEKNPKLAELDAELRATVADAVGYALAGGRDPAEAVRELGEHNLELQEERRVELLVAGLPEDWLDEICDCPICHDTGRTPEGPCACLMELYAEEQRRELSSMLKLGEETFDNFDLSLYSDEIDPALGVSPRANMETVLDTCYQYARRFGKTSLKNLFLSGGTGLGKTFLSTCIAKVVAEGGHSVVYDTAGTVFAKYEELKFGRGDEAALRADIDRYERCDLLILDDLGTEFPTSFVTSALYTLLNTRLAAGRRMVISSNFKPEALRARYSAPVISRLEGEFTVLTFFGDDIRLLKR